MVRAGRDRGGQWYLGRGVGRGIWWCLDAGCGRNLKAPHVTRSLRAAVSEGEVESLRVLARGSGSTPR